MSINKNSWRNSLLVFFAFFTNFSSYPQAQQVFATSETSSNVIEITTIEDFLSIQDDLSGNYRVMNDIDFQGLQIQPFQGGFQGILNGNNFELSNFTLKNLNSQTALFQSNQGIIENLRFSNISFLNTWIDRTFKSTVASDQLSIIASFNESMGIIRNIKINLNLAFDNGLITLFSNYFSSVTYSIHFSLISYSNVGRIENIELNLIGDISLGLNYSYGADFNGHFGAISSINSGTIQNVSLVSAISIQFPRYGRVYYGSLVASNSNKINNNRIYQNNIVAIPNSSNDGTLGGVVGLNDTNGILSENEIFNFDSILIHSASNPISKIGGIVGTNYGMIQNTYLFLENVLNYNVSISSIQNHTLGGIIGRNFGTFANQISHIISEGKITINVSGANVAGTPTFFLSRGIGFNETTHENSFNHFFSDLQIKIQASTTSSSTANNIRNRFATNYKTFQNGTVQFDNDYNQTTNDSISFLYGAQIALQPIQGIAPVLENVDRFSVLELMQQANPNSVNQTWTIDILSKNQLPILHEIERSFSTIQRNYTASNIHTAQYEIFKEGVSFNNESLTIGTYYLIDVGLYDYFIEDNMFKYRIQYELDPFIQGLNNLQSYTGSVSPIIQASSAMELNGEPYDGSTISTPGTHELKILGINGYEKVLMFNIQLVLSSVTDEARYTSPIKPNWSGGNAFLNEEVYNGDIISDVGYYELTIYGVNNFSQKTVFYIDPVIEGVVEGETYTGKATPVILGGTSISLNGQTYDGNEITEPGDHTLTIYGVNEYEFNIHFSVSLEVSNVDNVQYGNPIAPTFSGGSATLNGEAFLPGTEISEVGNYELIINGVNGFSETFNFSIEPKIIGLSDGITYPKQVIPVIQGGETYTLNNLPYESATPITTPGQHELIIYGKNGYRKTITFIVALETENIFNGATYTTAVTPIISGGNVTLNGQPFDILEPTTLTKVGRYVFIISGVNDYQETITIYINPIINNITEGNTYVKSIIPNIEGDYNAITLNGSNYVEGTTINNPGQNTLAFYGINDHIYTLTFNIQLTFEAFKVFKPSKESSAYLTFSGGLATRNGNPYLSGEVFNQTGNHEIIIKGFDNEETIVVITLEAFVRNLRNNTTYQSFIIPFIVHHEAILLLNEENYTLGQAITNPGKNYLTILGEGNYSITFEFTIEPIISGIINNGTYVNQSVTLFASGGTITSNGVLIYSGHIFDEVGNYTVEIQGANDYLLIIYFTIQPTIAGLRNGVIYQGNVQPVISGLGLTLALNGSPYQGEQITMPGNHELILTSNNGDYRQTFLFTVNLLVQNVIDKETYYDVIKPTFSGGIIYLNGVTFQSGYPIEGIGTFEIELYGVNGYFRNWAITIHPFLITLPDQNKSYENFNFNIQKIHSMTSIRMNNQLLNHSMNLIQIGNYQLEILFNETLLVDINFIIEPLRYIEDNQTYVVPTWLTDYNAQIVINEAHISDRFRFDHDGIYVVEIFGLNDYYYTFTVIFLNPHTEFFNNLIIPSMSMVALSLGIHLIRKRFMI